MNPSLIPNFLRQLKRVQSSSSVRNPYDSKQCVRNLRAYLELLCASSYSGHLLIGEAPGYKGCALTGIPFTSQRVLASRSHPFLDTLRPSLSITGDVSEATATIVWDYLADCQAVPAMWNIFPFHPHAPGNLQSNRRPTSAEVHGSKRFIQRVFDILTPETVIAVGNTSAAALNQMFPDLDFKSIRHPSFGGKSDFVKGMRQVGVR